MAKLTKKQKRLKKEIKKAQKRHRESGQAEIATQAEALVEVLPAEWRLFAEGLALERALEVAAPKKQPEARRLYAEWLLATFGPDDPPSRVVRYNRLSNFSSSWLYKMRKAAAREDWDGEVKEHLYRETHPGRRARRKFEFTDDAADAPYGAERFEEC